MPLEEQDRLQWDRERIREGLELVERALRLGRVGPYQLQAAIAAVHAEAQAAGETDWRQIAALYRELARVHPTAIVALNHAVAVALSEGLETGLRLIDELGASGELQSYLSTMPREPTSCVVWVVRGRRKWRTGDRLA